MIKRHDWSLVDHSVEGWGLGHDDLLGGFFEAHLGWERELGCWSEGIELRDSSNRQDHLMIIVRWGNSYDRRDYQRLPDRRLLLLPYHRPNIPAAHNLTMHIIQTIGPTLHLQHRLVLLNLVQPHYIGRRGRERFVPGLEGY